MDAHAKYAPSGMYPTVKCHGRRVMINGIEEEETDSSREGTACHWVAEQLLSETLVPTGYVSPNGVVITDEMIDAATAYVAVINDTADGQAYIEQRVAMPQIHEECWGTSDAFWYDREKGVIHVWDFKFGHSSVVAYENYQLMAYAVGAVNEYKTKVLLPADIKLQLHIVQPRCYDGNGLVRSWATSMKSITPYVIEMMQACAASDQGGSPVVSGSHCTHCPGRHVCSAARDAAAKAFEYSHSPLPKIPDANALGYELAVLSMAQEAIKNRKEALEVDAMARMRAGQPVPGFDVKQGYSREKWNVPVEEVEALGTLMGVDFTKTALLTPTQAGTLLKKNAIDATVIKSYHGKEPTAMKLVRDDGSRAKLIFNSEK